LMLPAQYLSFFRGETMHFKEEVVHSAKDVLQVDIPTIFSRFDSKSTFIKVDIEGSEYDIIKDLVRFQDRILAMTIEFHDTSNLRASFIAAIQMLSKHFYIVHIHGNNFSSIGIDNLPTVLEISFLNRQNFKPSQNWTFLQSLQLDKPNNPHDLDIEIVFSSTSHSKSIE
jgi:hypothetical protein